MEVWGRILRHPSYFGFYYYSLGTQVLLMNPVGVVGYVFALNWFFQGRIEYEEATLIEFFGPRYQEYMKETGIWIPLF